MSYPDYSTKVRKKPPKRQDGGEDFRNTEEKPHVPKNKYKRVSKQNLQDEIMEEFNDEEEL